MEVKYNPQPGDAQVIREHGVTLEAGKFVSVDDKHPKADKFRGNPTLEVKGAKKEVKEGEENPELTIDPEIVKVRAQLTEKGIKWHHKAGLATLQDLLAGKPAEAEKTKK